MGNNNSKIKDNEQGTQKQLIPKRLDVDIGDEKLICKTKQLIPERLKVDIDGQELMCKKFGWFLQCKQCENKNPINIQKCNKCQADLDEVDMVDIPIDIVVEDEVCTQLLLKFPYALDVSAAIKHIYYVMRLLMNQMNAPMKYQYDFRNSICEDMWEKKMTEFPRNEITQDGFRIFMRVLCGHEIEDVKITCPHMLQSNQSMECKQSDRAELKNQSPNYLDPMICPIYSSLNNYFYTENHLEHLNEFSHFQNEFSEKKECKYWQHCKAYKRLGNGETRLDDRCHVKLFRHPPRCNSQIKMKDYNVSFVVNKKYVDVEPVYKPTEQDKIQFNYNEKNGYLNALIEEVIKNGYKVDLCLFCQKNQCCKHKEYSVLTIVDQKLKHIRHRQMGNPLNRAQMLALILYTGCECNHNLCEMQRNADFITWKWFDYCLYSAIEKLSEREIGKYKVYTGISSVKLQQRKLDKCYFRTYISTSWSRDVSLGFAVCGMLIEFNEEVRKNQLSCDVSWISHFQEEKKYYLQDHVQYLMHWI